MSPTGASLRLRPRALVAKSYSSQSPAFLVEDNGKISLVLDQTILRGHQHVGLLTIPFHLVSRACWSFVKYLDVVDQSLNAKASR